MILTQRLSKWELLELKEGIATLRNIENNNICRIQTSGIEDLKRRFDKANQPIIKDSYTSDASFGDVYDPY